MERSFSVSRRLVPMASEDAPPMIGLVDDLHVDLYAKRHFQPFTNRHVPLYPTILDLGSGIGAPGHVMRPSQTSAARHRAQTRVTRPGTRSYSAIGIPPPGD